MRLGKLVSLVAALLLVGGVAHPEAVNKVSVGDVPGTEGKWQTGEVTVAAPAAEVQRWFVDVRQWPVRFPDDTWVRDLGRAPDGRRVAEFHSKVVDRTLTVRIRDRPGLITYDGSGKGITTQGRIYFQPVGPDHTRIVMQTTGELHGAVGFFASENMKRKRALKKITADLEAAVRLSNAYAAARRGRG
jgi:hypothetical protein